MRIGSERAAHDTAGLISQAPPTMMDVFPGGDRFRRGMRSSLVHVEGVIFLVNPVAKNLDANDNVYALAA